MSENPYQHLLDLKIPGWSSVNELALLASLASRVPANGTIVELGSFAGRTAYAMSKHAPQADIYCVDTWPNFDFNDIPKNALAYMEGDYSDFQSESFFAYFKQKVRDCKNIHWIRGKSQEVPWPEDKPIDLIFVDADHEEEPLFQDLVTWWPRMEKLGMLVGHDWQIQSVKNAVMRFQQYQHDQKVFTQLVQFPSTSIWGLIRGLKHGQRWGIDLSSLYPLGDNNFTVPNKKLLQE